MEVLGLLGDNSYPFISISANSSSTYEVAFAGTAQKRMGTRRHNTIKKIGGMVNDHRFGLQGLLPRLPEAIEKRSVSAITRGW